MTAMDVLQLKGFLASFGEKCFQFHVLILNILNCFSPRATMVDDISPCSWIIQRRQIGIPNDLHASADILDTRD